MSTQRITFVVSMLILCLAACYSQAIPVNDHTALSISSRLSTSPGEDDQQALADDDSDFTDDIQLLHANINRSLAQVTILPCVGDETIVMPSRRSTSAT